MNEIVNALLVTLAVISMVIGVAVIVHRLRTDGGDYLDSLVETVMGVLVLIFLTAITYGIMYG